MMISMTIRGFLRAISLLIAELKTKRNGKINGRKKVAVSDVVNSGVVVDF